MPCHLEPEKMSCDCYDIGKINFKDGEATSIKNKGIHIKKPTLLFKLFGGSLTVV